VIEDAAVTRLCAFRRRPASTWSRRAMLGIAALLPLMSEGAPIVNVGSVVGLTEHYTVPYTTSK
jgi:hypothetical protein